MASEINFIPGEAPKAAWSVVVVFEDAAARKEAMKFCDRLIERFWAQYAFDVNWWSFDELDQSRQARDASTKAAEMDLIIFATGPNRELPLGVKHWVETWIGQRGEREGALIGLVSPGAGEKACSEKHMFLRSVAHRGAMDYWTQLPQDLSRTIPNSMASLDERANRVTSVLDEILQYVPPPPRLVS
jgi:hypothetical protein